MVLKVLVLVVFEEAELARLMRDDAISELKISTVIIRKIACFILIQVLQIRRCEHFFQLAFPVFVVFSWDVDLELLDRDAYLLLIGDRRNVFR